jgi:oligopeptidase A
VLLTIFKGKKDFMNNPLLEKAVIQHDIDFKKILPEHFEQAFTTLIPQVKSEHEWSVTQAPLTYISLFETEGASEQLEMVISILDNLNNVVQTPEVRELYEKWIPQIMALYNELGLDERGYFRIKEYVKTEEYQTLSVLRQKKIEDVIESYEINGIALPQEQKDKLKALEVKLTELNTLFNNNGKDTDVQKEALFTKEELKGLSERSLENATLKNVDNQELYQVRYASGIYSDIMEYADNENTRRTIYEQNLQDGIKEGLDNRPLLNQIITIRQEKAAILGFENHATLKLKKRMVQTPEKALSFIENLATRSLGQAKEESQSIRDYAQKLLGREMAFHDRAYVINKMRKELFSQDNELIRQYFPVRQVIAGLFEMIENLYAIRFIRNEQKNAWHDDVLIYDLQDAKNGEAIGSLYMDLYRRDFKNDGAWMNGVVSRHQSEKTLTLPVAYIVCNAPKDAGQEPTFELDEIVTLFHEMGHALHHLLTRVNDDYYSGINHVEHDAVELPSQFMENFCWDYEIIKKISSHIKTGEVFPQTMFDNLLKGKNFLSALMMLRQVTFAKLDMRLYSEKDIDAMTVEKEVFSEYQTGPRDERGAFLPNFAHIFPGGYSAGYYSYKWAEVLSSDAYAALKEQGNTYMEQKEMAQHFRQHILETGGYGAMKDKYQQFRGQEPDITHLLKDNGINSVQ